ncbi:MAG: Rhs family protein [Paenibacillus sp.]|nr:Rhs family protein [Paenibacillus sp.]
MVTESMSLREDSRGYAANRSQLGNTFQSVFDDPGNNQFMYLYGLLTQTSPYENSNGNAEWAKSELLNALDKHTDFNWEIAVSAEQTISTAVAAIPSRRNTAIPQLSSQHYIPKSIVYQYDEIILGRGTPRVDHNGNQKVFNATELKGVSGPMNVWAGSLEYDVPGTNHRILKRPDGKLGYVLEHDYSQPKIFPGPWFPDGGIKK